MSADELSKKAESYVRGLNKKIDGVEINLESDDIDDLQNQLTAINDYRANLDVNTEDYKHATIVATELLRTQQKLTDSKTPVLNVDTSQYTDKIQTAISTIQQYNDALNSLEEAKLGGDTSKIDEAQQKVNTLKSTMDTLQSDGTFATIDFTFNAETFKQDIANINVNSLAKDTEITPSVDLSDVESGSKKAKSILENTKPKIKPTVDASALHNNIQNAINSQPIRISDFDLSGVHMGTGSYKNLMDPNNIEVPDTKSIGNNSFSELYTKATQSVRGSAPSRVSHYRNTSSSNRVNGNNGSSSTDSANEFLEVMDWIEVKIQRCEEQIERLDKVANNTFTSWTNRTSKLNSEIAATADEIKWATAGYQEYLAKAESINLSEEYKQKVREGRIQIEDIKDENLRNAISDYQEWYENAVQLSDSIEELNQQLSELQKMKFDNIIQQFEDMQSIPSNIVSQIDELVSLAEARGRVISRRYYQVQYRQEVRNNNSLVQERNRLQDSLNEAVDTGRITRGSEAWYEMYNAIQDVNRAIIESNTNLAEYANSMRQVDWDLFDLARERVNNLSSEIEFMTSLLSDEKLTDGSLDRGLTKYGIAQIGQYATMYNIAMAQAQDYADEINKIEKELQNDPANQDLINRKQELVEAQQQAIQSANDEKQAMIDLAREGYDAVLDRMQELINKRNEALDAEKDLYDYQKSIAEKTKNIAELQKQLSVYTNDNSEEAKKRIQQIQIELENAQQDLEDTEYDRYISDQKDLLDDLYNDYSDKIDEKFENTDNIIKEYIGITNENTSQINRTLRDVASEVGYNMSTELKKIWNSSTNTNSVVATFNNDFKTHSTSVLASLERIDGLIRNYYRVANNEANSQVNNIGDNSTTGVSPNLVTTSDGSVRIVLPTNGTANLVQITKFDANLLQPITDTFKNITPNNTTNGNLSINIENINLDNVTDAKEFSNSLVNAIQTDKKVFGALESKLINPLVGKSTKKVNKY